MIRRLLFAIAILASLAFALEAQIQIDVNRPRSEFDCDTPRSEEFFGSTERCLQEMCAGKNVYNQYIFDTDSRRRRNPCYGVSPTQFGERWTR